MQSTRGRGGRPAPVVRATAEAGPLLLVVDDATSSTTRRPTRSPRDSADCLCCRSACWPPPDPPAGPCRSGSPSWAHRRDQSPAVDAAALFHLVREHLGRALDRGALRAVEAASGGNPLHALEFAATTAGRGSTFEHLLEDRLRLAPQADQAGSPGGRPGRGSDRRAGRGARRCSPTELLDVLEPAVRERLARVTYQVSFTHPLYAETIVSTSAAADRQECHRRLARIEPGAEARARHLGIATTGPDTGWRDPRGRGPARPSSRSLGLGGRADGAQRRADATGVERVGAASTRAGGVAGRHRSPGRGRALLRAGAGGRGG